MDAFKKLRRHSVVVHLDSKSPTYYKKVAPAVSRAFQRREIGLTIPKAVISSHDQAKVFAIMSYHQLKTNKEYSKVSKIVKTAIKENLASKNKKEVFAMEKWESASNSKTIDAKFVKLEGDKITLKKSDGRNVQFSVKFLSEKSQARARELAKP